MNLKRFALVMSVGIGVIGALILLRLLGSSGTPVIAGAVKSVANVLEASTAEEHVESLLSNADTIHYVAITGTDSGDCSAPAGACRTIQYAVDAASDGDLIKVATGIYTGVQSRPVPPGYPYGPANSTITQVLYVSKTVTVRGGYTTTNWSTSYPMTQPTTLDAHRQGRVLLITGDISPTVEGLWITGGDATGLGGGASEEDAGGGVYVITATATISNNWVFSNTAAITGSGGGLYLRNSKAPILSSNWISGNSTVTGKGGGLYFDNSSNATLTENTIINNKASPSIPPGGRGGSGGGAFFYTSPEPRLDGNYISGNKATFGAGLFFRDSPTATLVANTINNNVANHLGGGQKHHGGAYFLSSANATLINNTISDNWAADTCGGITFRSGSANAMLIGNNVIGNSAGSPGFPGVGGGLCFISSNGATLISNMIAENNSITHGGGLYLERSNITLTNNVITDNQAAIAGSGLYVVGSYPQLVHTTIARNGDGSGVYVTDGWGYFSTVAMTNTILVSHTVGITVTAGNTATLNGVLWYSNIINYDGGGTITVATAYTGDPAFDTDGYHLMAASAAIDKGVSAGVDHDIDGDLRPMGHGYDLGADELRIALTVTKQADPNPVQAGAPLTYTIRVTNTGDMELHATITDVLPEHVTPIGIQTWTPGPIATDDVWTQQVTVTAKMGYSGTLTNVVRVTTFEGAVGIYTETSQAKVTPALTVTKQAAPDPVQPGSPLTYTIRVTNAGNITLNATITDILPQWVTPTGVLTWAAVIPVPCGVWMETVVVTAQLGACELVNRVQVATDEGARGDHAETSAVDADCIYLPVLFKNYDPRLIEVSGILRVWDVCAFCCYYVGLETTSEFYELATFLGRQYDGLYVRVRGLLEGPCAVSFSPVIHVMSIEVLEPPP